VLEINGVGYRADARGSTVHLTLGYSHPILYQLPPGVSAAVDKQTVITLSGVDRQLVGEVAAGIRKLRPPEPYKGKGRSVTRTSTCAARRQSRRDRQIGCGGATRREGRATAK
jgi:ribosomal protein L6P/L9E